jgi:cell wall-associated NlpC family hydrolase
MIGPVIAAAVIGVPLGLLAWWVRDRGDGSELEEEDPMRNVDAGALQSALGWPYFFGRGSPSTPWEDGPNGVDCSGFAQMALVKLGILSSDAGDRGARTLADDSDPLELGEQEPGDLAYYPGHVMVVISGPGADGHSEVMGASGGTSTTFGDDDGAYVKAFSSGAYRSDFVCYMRLR